MLAQQTANDVAVLLQQGVAAARQGDKEAAKQIIQRVAEIEPNNEAAWLWLASLYTELDVAAYCLQRALALNPENAQAASALQRVQERLAAAQPVQPAQPEPQPAPPQAGQWDAVQYSGRAQNPTAAQNPTPNQPNDEHTLLKSLGFDEAKRRGIVAAKGGRREEAKACLLAATELNDSDPESWHWLATVVEDIEDKQIALENVLTLEPLNLAARQAMEENSAALLAKQAQAREEQATQQTPQNTRKQEATGPSVQPGQGEASKLFDATSGGNSSKQPPKIGEVIAGKYQILNSSEGHAGTDYTAVDIKKSRFYMLRAQKCDVGDLKKAKANFISHNSSLFTLIPISTDGLTLRNFVVTVGALPTDKAISYAQAMLKELDAHHTRGPILSATRQITPDYVAFNSTGNLLLEPPEVQVSNNIDAYTKPYISPEQANRGSLSPTSDIYSMGALLFFMITGARPPLSEMVPRKTGDKIHPTHFEGHPNIPESLVKVIATAMQVHPSDRYRSAKEMSDALAACGIAAPKQNSSKKPFMLAGLFVAGAVVLGLLFMGGKLPFGSSKAVQAQVAYIPPTATVAAVIEPTAVPVIPLARTLIHTVDARRFPANTLFFNAIDTNGAPISGLTLDTLKLTDNGNNAENMQLINLKSTIDPISVIVVLDNSMPMAGKPMDDAKTAIHLFVEAMQPGDQMALITYGGGVKYVLDYTVSKTEFLTDLDAVKPSGKPDLATALALAAKRTSHQPQGGYTALVVVSNAPLAGTKAAMQNMTKTVSAANLPVFFVGLNKNTYTPDTAQQLADSSGGIAVVAEPADAGGASEALKKVDLQLHSSYKLTYKATVADNKNEHNVELSVTTGGVTQTDTATYTVLRR